MFLYGGEQNDKTIENNESSYVEESSDYDIEDFMVWIPTKCGIKYHKRASCSNMKEPDHVTILEAKERGFAPCKKCFK